MRFAFLSTLIIGSLFTLVGTASAATTLDVYLSAPDSQVTPFANTTVETFESLTAGTNQTTNYLGAIGTYVLDATTRFAVVADDQYGNGTGNYMSIGAQSGSSAPVTLNLTTPARYFGFAFQAGDTNNGLTFYSGTTLIGRFSTATILSLLGSTTVKAVNGTTYQSSQYKGKPNTTNVNTGEAYSFVNFFANGGTFDRVVFDNSNTTGTGFESDNHTVSSAAQTPQGDFVVVGSVVVPEAETGVLFAGTGIAFAGMIVVRRRKH